MKIEKRDNLFVFKCPGCKCDHHFTASWQFDGNMNCPTVSPSILTRWCKYPEENPATGDFYRGDDGKYLLDSNGMLFGAKKMVCHIFIRNGMIEYLNDCTHELAGKTVPMESAE